MARDIALWPYAENRLWFDALMNQVSRFISEEDSHDLEVFIPIEVIHRMHNNG